MTTPGLAPAAAVSAQPTQDSLTVQQIVLILAAGLAVKATIDHLVSTLAGTGIGRAAIVAAWRAGGFGPRHRGTVAAVTKVTAGVDVLPGPGSRAPAVAADVGQEPIFRAAYLLASARRIQTAVDGARLAGADADEALRTAQAREARFYAAHEHALANRRRAAAQVDRTARNSGTIGVDPLTGLPAPVVAWHAVLDSKTSAECRAADGHVFPTVRPPMIGWPGAVHPHCRCSARPAEPGMPLLDGTGFFWPA